MFLYNIQTVLSIKFVAMEILLLEDKRPKWALSYIKGYQYVEHDGLMFSYAILKKDLEPNLPGFLGFYEGFLFISEDVPYQFRAPQLLHEIWEFTRYAKIKGSCAKATKQELEYAKNNMKQYLYLSYLRYRIVFFKRLIKYYKRQNESFDTSEFSCSLKVLRDEWQKVTPSKNRQK